MSGEWDTLAFAAQLGWAGTARVALACAAGGAVEVASLKVAQIGA
jgi:hypothetical protein